MTSFNEAQQTHGPASFDDEVRTSAQQQARILRDLGYRSEATHIDRFVDRETGVNAEESAA